MCRRQDAAGLVEKLDYGLDGTVTRVDAPLHKTRTLLSVNALYLTSMSGASDFSNGTTSAGTVAGRHLVSGLTHADSGRTVRVYEEILGLVVVAGNWERDERAFDRQQRDAPMSMSLKSISSSP